MKPFIRRNIFNHRLTPLHAMLTWITMRGWQTWSSGR